MAPATDRESAVLGLMRGISTTSRPSGRCRVPGLVNLYNTLAQLDGVPARGFTAAQITDLAMRGEDPLCIETTNMFCAMLGTMAGNLALTLGPAGMSISAAASSRTRSRPCRLAVSRTLRG